MKITELKNTKREKYLLIGSVTGEADKEQKSEQKREKTEKSNEQSPQVHVEQ